MKKQIFGLLLVLLVSSFVADAYADPKYGLIKDTGKKHIVRNWLYNNLADISGSVTFACQSLEGFEYSVSVKGLSPRTTYSVQAESLEAAFRPFPPFNGWVATSDGDGQTYSLGNIRTNRNGEGEVSGLFSLPPGIYNWEIKVDDPDGIEVLRTIQCIPYSVPGDPIDFDVFPEWPSP